MTIIANMVYASGHRVDAPDTLQQTFRALCTPGRMAWIALDGADEDHLAELAEGLGLHELAVEDAVEGDQRPKHDRYGDHHLIVLRPARYLDDEETVEYGELDVFVGPNYVVTVRHTDVPDLRGVQQRLEQSPSNLQAGPVAVVHAILDDVVDGYLPVAEGLELDIDEIEAQVFAGESEVSRRIFGLSRQITRFHHVVRPLPTMLERLSRLLAGAPDVNLDVNFDVRGQVDADADQAGERTLVEADRALRDVLDHAVRLDERIEGMRSLLANALELDSTMASKRLAEISVNQNEQSKKIASWAAIIFAPQLIGSIYGMNFDVMPELHWIWGYPFALALMATVALTLFVVFKRNDWL